MLLGRAGPTALILAITGVVSPAADGRAQTTEEPDRIRDRIFAGVAFGGAFAVGEFSDFVNLAGGAAFDLVFHLPNLGDDPFTESAGSLVVTKPAERQ